MYFLQHHVNLYKLCEEDIVQYVLQNDPNPALLSAYLRHVVDQQQRHGDGGDVVAAADLQNVSQAHDGWVTGCNVA